MFMLRRLGNEFMIKHLNYLGFLRVERNALWETALPLVVSSP